MEKCHPQAQEQTEQSEQTEQKAQSESAWF